MFSGKRTFCLYPCLVFFPVIWIMLTVSCQGERDEFVRKKLDVIIKDDLQAIIADIPEENLREVPSYNLVSYQEYSKGKYSVKAVVDFFFLKNVKVKIVRKYRYEASKRMWERYYNEYEYLPDSFSATGP